MVRAHDLLKLSCSPLPGDAPAWAHAILKRVPYAVVRRAPHADDRIAIGVRGESREQRYAASANRQDIEAIVCPEHLLDVTPAIHRGALGAFVALKRLLAARCMARYEWGPTGSAGFELATGMPAVGPSSDLDLIVRAPREMAHGNAAALLACLQAEASLAGVRIDVQLETPTGAIALSEWAAGKPRTMLRTAEGPRLVENPWSTRLVDASLSQGT